MNTIGEDFPRQQARVRELIGIYRDIGPAGMFGAMMLEQSLAEADAAQASGDIVRIIRAYEALRGCK
jgi:hypothetical protein